ncbi:MAG: hypothetical protein ABEI52_02365 [Halobacteriaceae archaeon]
MGSTDANATTVSVRRCSPTGLAPPIVRRVPYLELKLEHRGIEPTGNTEQFYPDAVPYETATTNRVFYWRNALGATSPAPSEWQLAYATTDALLGIDDPPKRSPSLTTDSTPGTTVVVDGTIAGDARTVCLDRYSSPDVQFETVSESRVELSVDGDLFPVSAGDRRRIELSEQYVDPISDGQQRTTVTPVLAVRFPGKREIHHPGAGATYRLFPSFGLEIGELPDVMTVPTMAGELDHTALAERLDVDLSNRPYPVRVLWQAFAYTAFDPHDGGPPRLTQLQSGHIVLHTEK